MDWDFAKIYTFILYFFVELFRAAGVLEKFKNAGVDLEAAYEKAAGIEEDA